MKVFIFIGLIMAASNALADGITSNPPMFTIDEYIAKKCTKSFKENFYDFINRFGASISYVSSTIDCGLKIQEENEKNGYVQECFLAPNLKLKEDLKQVDAPKPLSLHDGRMICEKVYFLKPDAKVSQSRAVKKVVKEEDPGIFSGANEKVLENLVRPPLEAGKTAK
jgi:hypothetical protein